jgi:hypothetical protein
MPRLRRAPVATSTVIATLMCVLVLGGLLLWFLPAMKIKEQVTAGVPTPPALSVLSEFAVAPHEKACMNLITITHESALVAFNLRPAIPGPRLGPPVELVLTGPGYRSSANVPGGYPGGSVTLPVTPPSRELIGEACFLNVGRSTVLLDGTSEARTAARSSTVVAGRPVAGDIAMTFFESKPRTILSRLGEIFTHASNLTEGLIPVWLVWLIAILAMAGIPAGAIAAFWQSLRGDEEPVSHG